MVNYLSYFKGSYILIPILVVLACLLTFIDSKVNKKKIVSSDYIKVSLLTVLIGVICIYINTMKGAGIHEEIISGPAPF